MDTRASVITGIAALALLFAACGQGAAATTPQPMGGMAAPVQTKDLAPPVKGFYKGGEVTFIHTEATDPQVADMLTRMMGPKVVLVPGLAQVPQSALSTVYVFTNGVKGDGPFGFQPDVFDSVPGDQGYSPLRALSLVTWKEGGKARLLRSVDEIKAAEAKGEVAIKQTSNVVNMPILSWPGGKR